MNHDDINQKPKPVQVIWSLLQKMDPSSIFLSDDALVFLEGGPDTRRMSSMGFTSEEQRNLKSIAIPDCVEADTDGKSNPNSSVGTIVSVYQLIELAYLQGRADEIKTATAKVLSSDDDDDEFDGDFDDDFDEEE